MRRVTRLACLASLLLLGACTIWPPAGTGGWAEHAPAATEADPRLVVAQNRFAELAAGEVGRRSPAAVVEIRVLMVRALRSSAADLEPAAQTDLVAFEQAVDALAGARAAPQPLVTRERAS
jgi:hypothetical protein